VFAFSGFAEEEVEVEAVEGLDWEVVERAAVGVVEETVADVG
jgi:hypothetical protein